MAINVTPTSARAHMQTRQARADEEAHDTRQQGQTSRRASRPTRRSGIAKAQRQETLDSKNEKAAKYKCAAVHRVSMKRGVQVLNMCPPRKQ